MKARIAITDDHQLFVDGLSSILNRTESLEVVLKTTSSASLFAELEKGIAVDVLFLDLDMPEMDGLETLKILTKKYPALHVVILSMHEEESIILHAIENGASAYLLKNSSVDILTRSVREILENGCYFDGFIVDIMRKGIFLQSSNPFAKSENSVLSVRESEVLTFLCKEMTAAEISNKMGISQRTVEGYKKKLLEKTNSRNIVGLILNSIKLGYINLDDVQH